MALAHATAVVRIAVIEIAPTATMSLPDSAATLCVALNIDLVRDKTSPV
jgi:hypothetical protein